MDAISSIKTSPRRLPLSAMWRQSISSMEGASSWVSMIEFMVNDVFLTRGKKRFSLYVVMMGAFSWVFTSLF
jgi:hypothetical protein